MKKPAVYAPIKSRARLQRRTRLAPAQKTAKPEPKSHPAKRRGRPKATTKGPLVKKPLSRKPGKVARISGAAVAKPTGMAPRKKRGITALDVPTKFVAQVEQYLLELQAGTLATPQERDVEAVIEDQNETDTEAAGEDHDNIVLEQDDVSIAGSSNNANVDEDSADELEGNANGQYGQEEEELSEGDLHADQTQQGDRQFDSGSIGMAEDSIREESTEIITRVETTIVDHEEIDATTLGKSLEGGQVEEDRQGLEKEWTPMPVVADGSDRDGFMHTPQPTLLLGAIFSPV